MTQETAVVPFGKYKGQTVDQIAARDPGYLQWLQQQPWAREKFPVLIVNINNFGQVPEETPDHNRMQIRFLDDRYRAAFAAIVRDLASAAEMREIMVDRWRARWKLVAKCRHGSEMPWYMKPSYTKHADGIDRDRGAKFLKEKGAELQSVWDTRKTIRALSDSALFKWYLAQPRFEVDGIDVVFESRVELTWPESYGIDRVYFCVEIKPTVGDDFPSILRQMKRYMQDRSSGYSHVLLIGTYTGEGATLDQMVQFFANSGITVVMASEVEAKLTACGD